jgi:uncharacterized membrane protein YeiH
MGEGRASGVPWGAALGRATREGWRGVISNGIANAQRGKTPLRCAHVAPESTRHGEETLAVPVEFRGYATTTLLVLDLVGTFAFALSGGLAGAKKRLDLFGVLVLSFAASTAGGITRDILIGAIPPAAIRDWRYVAVSLLAGLVTFYWYPIVHRLRNHVLVFDGAGLALFAVTGTQKALGYGLNPVMAMLLGVLTGIGGGMLRDLLLAQVPTVLRAELYAVAALAGVVVVVVGHALHLQPTAVPIAGAALCFGLRLMAIRRGWHLPIAYPSLHPDAEPDAPSGENDNEAQR